MILVHDVNSKNKDYQKLKNLYHKSFPKIEKLPFSVLRVMALKPNIDFLAVYDDQLFIGLLYLVNYKETTLLYYFAVDQNIRSKGYGSEILRWIKNNKRSSISLIMETVYEECDNLEQRIHRKNFYIRNGFVDTGYYMKDYSGTFDILSTDKDINPKEFIRLLKQFCFWMSVDVQKWNK